METCNCDFICPSIGSNLTARPTEGDCKVALAMRIDKGEKNAVRLDGVKVIVLADAPGPMIDGNWKVGLIVDDGASDAQVEAIGAIISGAEGGPMEVLAALIGEMVGIERRPISCEVDGMRYAVKAGELVDQEAAGVPGMVNEEEPIFLVNTGHPLNSKLALAKAARSRFHAFGIDWEDTSGTRNGHFAPFSWTV